MNRKTVSGLMLTLPLISMLALAFNIPPVKAIGTIYIRADGTVDPPTAPIQRDGDIYTLTSDVYDEIVVQRSNIIIDGGGYTLQGFGSGEGFNLTGVSNVSIKLTNIKRFECGIGLHYSSNNSLSGNNITRVGLGIDLDHSLNNNVSGNNITDNVWDNIRLEYSSNNIISGNNMAKSNTGISLYKSSKNSIFGNNIADNPGRGIYVDRSLDNIISGNNMIENHNGIVLVYSSKNVIYHNNFVNNPKQADCNEPYVNIWDNGYPSGGNYWSDYTGIDEKRGPYQNETGSDGIGDVPYDIDENNQDHYPVTVLAVPVLPVWTQWWFWAIILLAGIGVVPFSFGIRYYRNFRKQRKIVLAYESELESLPISHLDRARARFMKDVIERKEKIQKFERKYSMGIRATDSFEDVLKKWGVDRSIDR